MKLISQTFKGCFLLILSVMCSAYAAEIQAQLDRNSVPAGNAAELIIQISGGNVARPVIPQVKDLIVNSAGQSHQIQIINGTTNVSITYTYQVGSHTPGDYVIPSTSIVVDGETLSTKPLKLKVLAEDAVQPPAGIPNANGTAATEPDSIASKNQFGFLTVEPATSDRKYVYVGEIAPVRIRAWIPADAQASLRSGIQPEGKAFTLHNVSDKPEQTEEMKDGKRYLVVTWYGGISATKAGTYPASLSLQATVAVRDTSTSQTRPRTGGPFDDPFFDQMMSQMNQHYIQKDITLNSSDQEIEVRPLPTQGRPKDFTGAVGEFKMEPVKFPTTLHTGEPQQLDVSVSGKGNFALLKAPSLTPEDVWRSYPGKDEFTPNDQASFSGTKHFQFSMVPRKGGEQGASLVFSYFDPAEGAYKTIRCPDQKVFVAGADLEEPKDQAPVVAPQKKSGEPTDSLVAQKLERDSSRPLEPLIFRSLFINGLFLAGGLILLGPVLAFFRRRRDDPKRRALSAMEKAIRAALHTANQCAEVKDVSGYFVAARSAIQQRLGLLWDQPAQAITSAEVAERIPQDSPVAEFFREADLHEYSRSALGEQMFPRWQQLLDQALSDLTQSSR
jgi:hypothetical protein